MVDGRETLELARAVAPESLTMFTISPDGSTAFAKRPRRVNGAEHSDLLRLPLDGSLARTAKLEDLDVGNLPGALNFSIHPDGKQVAFVAERARAQVPYEVWCSRTFFRGADQASRALVASASRS